MALIQKKGLKMNSFKKIKFYIYKFITNDSWEDISYYQILSGEFIREFQNKVNWAGISWNQNLSEEFIRKFKDKVDWYAISCAQKLPEEFIREFQDKVNWKGISCNQKLSEKFISEFKDEVNWYGISCRQKLSGESIREFKTKVDWGGISCNQILSEEFIREFEDKVNWFGISYNQILSEEFIKEFKDKIYIKVQMKKHHNKRTKDQKIKEIKAYAKEYKLKFNGKYLYAFRDHDQFGRGLFNKTNFYEKGKYYQDWHCDLDENEGASFGLGIFSEGNTKVKVKVEDWGCWVLNSNKCRVWGFEVI